MKSVKKKCEQCGDVRSVANNRKICFYCRHLNQKINTGEVLDKTYSDTTYAPYKDPMIKNESGFGYVGAIVQSKTGSHIQCNDCGYFFQDLGSHISHYHKEEARDYKIRYGLRVKKGLLSPMMLQKRQAMYNTHPIRKDAAKNAKLAKAALKKSRAAGNKPYNADTGSWIPQLRNERGQCADQLLEKIKELSNKLGYVCDVKQFEAEFGGGSVHSITTLHGSWNKAVEKAGLNTFTVRQRLRKLDRIESVIERMADWYEKHGRTPQTADFKNDDELPTERQVSMYFGGLNKAREADGNGIWVEVS